MSSTGHIQTGPGVIWSNILKECERLAGNT
jgi:hypothetical protein